jgi:hypothetical protein
MRARITGLVLLVILIAGFVATLVWRGPRPAVEESFDVLAGVVTSPPEVRVSLRRATAVRRGDDYTFEGLGYAGVQGDKAITRLRLEVILRRADGAEIERQSMEPVGFYERIYWVDPGYGVQFSVRATTRERPARCDVEAANVEPADGPPGTGADAWVKVHGPVWDGVPPPDGLLEIRASGFSVGPEGIVAPANAVLFDTRVGVRNVGSLPVRSLAFRVAFLDDGGTEVDTLGLKGPGELPLLPGDGAIYTAGRGVKPYVRSVLHAEWTP